MRLEIGLFSASTCAANRYDSRPFSLFSNVHVEFFKCSRYPHETYFFDLAHLQKLHRHMQWRISTLIVPIYMTALNSIFNKSNLNVSKTFDFFYELFKGHVYPQKFKIHVEKQKNGMKSAQ